MIVLIMGLPGAGKTTLTSKVHAALSGSVWLNADAVRQEYNDWDFSHEGRMRQAARMRELTIGRSMVLIDMVAPLQCMREVIRPDLLVWVDTIAYGRFTDTNKIFEPPADADLIVTTQDSSFWAAKVLELISNSATIANV